MAFKIRHLHVKCTDPQKAAKWWVENLGAVVSESQKGSGVDLDLHGITLNVSGFAKGYAHEQKYGLEHICIGTDDQVNVVNKIKASGGRVLEEVKNPAGRSVFFVETPEGVQLEISAKLD